jgi:nicotinamide-nucleotide amidase
VARLLEGLGGDLPQEVGLTVQYRATFPEIHVRLLLTGADEGSVEELLSGVADEARQRLARHVYAWGLDPVDTTFPETVVDDLRRAGLTVAVADGCTGGTVSQLLSSVTDVSDVFCGSIVAPGAPTLLNLLGADGQLTADHGEVSEQVAAAAATAVREGLRSDLGVAVVGTAMNGAQDSAGSLLVAISSDAGSSYRALQFPVEPDRFRHLAAYVALGLVRRVVAP